MSDRHELLPRNSAERQALLDACGIDRNGLTLTETTGKRIAARGRAAAEVIQAAAEALERLSRGQPFNPMSA